MRQMIIVAMLAASAALAAGARADVIGGNVIITGNDVPTNPVIDGLPGFSGYTIYFKAKNPGDLIWAIDAGSNPIDYPSVSYNWGIFGPMHQDWQNRGDGEVVPTAGPNSNPLDSHFLVTPNATVLGPEENNFTSPHGITSPLSDDDFNDYGVGDTMRIICGIANMDSDDVPFAYLVVPNGYTVEIDADVITRSEAQPSPEPAFESSFALTPGAIDGEGDVSSIISVTVGQVPEPATLGLALTGIALVLCRRRRRRIS